MHCDTASIFLHWSKSNRKELKIKNTEKTCRRGRTGRTEVRGRTEKKGIRRVKKWGKNKLGRKKLKSRRSKMD